MNTSSSTPDHLVQRRAAARAAVVNHDRASRARAERFDLGDHLVDQLGWLEGYLASAAESNPNDDAMLAAIVRGLVDGLGDVRAAEGGTR